MRALLGVVRNLPFSVILPNGVETVHSLFGQYTNGAYQSADRPSCIGASRETEKMDWVAGVIVVSQETVGFPNVLVESVSSPSFLMNFCQLHCPRRRFRDLNVFVERGERIESYWYQPSRCMRDWDTIGAIQSLILMKKVGGRVFS